MTGAAGVTASMLQLVAGAATAQAGDDGPPPADPPGSTGTTGQVITISVWSTGYSAGSSGSGDGHVSRTVPAPCWMEPFMSARSMPSWIGSVFDLSHEAGPVMTTTETAP
jgi:hypothetical protein